jgi:phosphatidylglycerophosphate synthase
MLKSSLSNLQKKAGKALSFLPLSPDQCTLLSVLFAAIGSYCIFQLSPLSLLFFLIAFLLDALDGALARAKGLSTPFGAYLDGICDRLVEFLALFPLFFLPSFMLPALLTLFFGSCMNSFSKAYADHRMGVDSGKAAAMRNLLPRAERTIGIFISIALLLFGYAQLSDFLLWAVAMLSMASFVLLQPEAARLAAKPARKG